LNPEGDPLSLNVSAETLSIFPTFPLSPLWDSLSLSLMGFPLSPPRECIRSVLLRETLSPSMHIPSLSLMGYIKGERISLWRSPSMYQHRLSLHSLSLPLSMAAPWS